MKGWTITMQVGSGGKKLDWESEWEIDRQYRHQFESQV